MRDYYVYILSNLSKTLYIGWDDLSASWNLLEDPSLRSTTVRLICFINTHAPLRIRIQGEREFYIDKFSYLSYTLPKLAVDTKHVYPL